MRALSFASLALLVAACDNAPVDGPGQDAGPRQDGGPIDAPPADAGAPPDDLDPLLEPIRAGAGLPALGAALYEGDTLLAIGTVGVRALGDPTPVTDDDRWHIGSCTKAMTATLIALYVEAGMVAWDTTVPELFPGITVDPGFQSVTLAALLAHRGGIDPAFDGTPWLGDTRPLDVQRAEISQAVFGAPPVVPPGGYAYSNVGYIAAAAVIERLTGRTWEDLMRERLFTPLGMTSCGFGAPGTSASIDEPRGHTGSPPMPLDPGTPGSDNPPVLGPAGTVHCNFRDWARFAALHNAGERGDPTPILDAAAIQRMHEPWPGGDYGYGWGVADRTWAGGLVLNHVGSNTFWVAVVWIAPARNRFFLITTNIATPEASTATSDVATQIVTNYF
jgi:D-alanyl-D-alanine carboxypeptidase